MNTMQLERVMKTDPYTRSQFRGVFAADQLPRRVKTYPSAYIVNTDPASEPGAHWVAFYFPQKDKGEFFDSYGDTPAYYSGIFKTFIKQNSCTWTYNHQPLQSLLSRVCGQYCLFYLLHRCHGVNMFKILRYFHKNKERNDRFVNEFICKHFSRILKLNMCNPYQSCVSERSKKAKKKCM